jgi:hypothetical protein
MRDPLIDQDAEQVKDCAEVYHAASGHQDAVPRTGGRPPGKLGGPVSGQPGNVDA